MIKLAVPTCAGEVDEHFGLCESFTIYSINADKAVVGQERFNPPPANGCKSALIPTLAEMGVTVLIAGSMGEGAVLRLGEAGIQVFRGAKGDVAEAVQSWLDGTLTDSQEFCTSHMDGHEGRHKQGN